MQKYHEEKQKPVDVTTWRTSDELTLSLWQLNRLTPIMSTFLDHDKQSLKTIEKRREKLKDDYSS